VTTSLFSEAQPV